MRNIWRTITFDVLPLIFAPPHRDGRSVPPPVETTWRCRLLRCPADGRCPRTGCRRRRSVSPLLTTPQNEMFFSWHQFLVRPCRPGRWIRGANPCLPIVLMASVSAYVPGRPSWLRGLNICHQGMTAGDVVVLSVLPYRCVLPLLPALNPGCRAPGSRALTVLGWSPE